MNTPQPPSPRRRLQALLAIPDSQRTDAEWDELNELEIQLAPGNREGAPDPNIRRNPSPGGGGNKGQGRQKKVASGAPKPPGGNPQGQAHGQGQSQGQGQGQGKKPFRKPRKKAPKGDAPRAEAAKSAEGAPKSEPAPKSEAS